MTRIKYTPLEIRDSIIEEIYQRIENKWKYALHTIKKVRGSSLARLMIDFGREEINEALEKYKNRFIQKRRSLYVLIGNLEYVDEDSQMF